MYIVRKGRTNWQ